MLRGHSEGETPNFKMGLMEKLNYYEQAYG